MTRDEIAGVFEEAKAQIEEALDNIRGAARHLSESDRELIRRGVLSHIETALSQDHSWLGKNYHTLQDTIEGLYDTREEDEQR